MENNFDSNLLHTLKLLNKHKWVIFLISTVSVILGVILALTLPRYYTSKTTLMVMSSSYGSSGLGALLGNLGEGGGNLLPNLSSASGNNKLIIPLKSRTLAEKVVKDMNLSPQLFPHLWDPVKKTWKGEVKTPPTITEAALELQSLVNLEKDPETEVLNLLVSSRDRKMAAEIANYYPKALEEYLNKNTLTLSKKSRIFIGHQIENNKKKLFEASKELSKFYASNKISTSQADVDIPADPVYGTDFEDLAVSPELAEKFQHEAETLEKKLLVRDVPAHIYLNYLIEYQGILMKVHVLLTNQHELAKIDESKKDIAFQVVDPALPSSIPSRPKRKLIVVVSFLIGFILSVMSLLIIDYVQRIKSLYRQRMNP